MVVLVLLMDKKLGQQLFCGIFDGGSCNFRWLQFMSINSTLERNSFSALTDAFLLNYINRDVLDQIASEEEVSWAPKSQTIHGTGIFTYMKTIKINHGFHVGKYIFTVRPRYIPFVPWIRHGKVWPTVVARVDRKIWSQGEWIIRLGF